MRLLLRIPLVLRRQVPYRLPQPLHEGLQRLLFGLLYNDNACIYDHCHSDTARFVPIS